jgi:hypothetical protein
MSLDSKLPKSSKPSRGNRPIKAIYLLVGYMGLITGALGLYVIYACTASPVRASGEFDLTCTTVTFEGRIGQRCENAEVVCYGITYEYSCYRK